jgi:hypothetical protein
MTEEEKTKMLEEIFGPLPDPVPVEQMTLHEQFDWYTYMGDEVSALRVANLLRQARIKISEMYKNGKLKLNGTSK